jgi:hypothetical protein
VFLFMYSDCTNYVDPHTIITIFLMFWLYLCISLQMDLYFLCSILAVEIFILLLALFSGLLRASSANIPGLIFFAYY